MEVRSIDANALLKDLNEAKIPYNADVNSFIISAPTLDYEPVVHAHWSDANGKWKKCSNCFRSNQYYSKYCPWCGAKMDEEVK